MKKNYPLWIASCFTGIFLNGNALADICSRGWDGEKLMIHKEGAQGSGISASYREVKTFHEAKEGISSATGRKPKLLICDDTQPNAFARTGRDGDEVGVTLGMIKLVGTDRDMAAIVIGHEYAHHILGHGASSQIRNRVFDVIGLIAGIALEAYVNKKYQVSGLGLDLGTQGTALVARKFDRDQEREADEVGFGYMLQSGFNPQGAVRLSNRLNEMGKSSGLFFDTHPGWAERADRFRTLIASIDSGQKLAVQSQPKASPAKQETITTLSAPPPKSRLAVAEQEYLDGAIAFQQRDSVLAVKLWRQSAHAGYAPAQSAMALLYTYGLGGVPQHDSEAVRLFQLAAKQGDDTGNIGLGWMYQEGRGGLTMNKEEAVRLYRISSGKGNQYGQLFLGAMYQKGLGGLPKDAAEAARLFKLAANQGNADAKARLALMSMTGTGGQAKDKDEGVRMLREAANQGSKDAQTTLARLHLEGKNGMPKDELEAAKWFRQAAERGQADAQVNLGMMYAIGKGGLAKDETEAAKWFIKSATQGNVFAQAALGNMFANGKGGLPNDDIEAEKWYRKAADQGNSIAQFHLGGMYGNGKGGLAKDEVEAAKWFKKAADQKYPRAQTTLGWMLEKGRGGMPVDIEQAISLYKEASAAGDSLASSHLKRLGVLN